MTVEQQMDQIRRKLVAYFLERDTFDDGAIAGKCFNSKAGEYLALQQADGSFPDVDYYCHESAANGRRWWPYLALDRMQAMAMAYANPKGEWYHDPAMLQGVEKAFSHWASIRDANSEKEDYEGPWSVNWWENGNGVQLRFSRIGVVLKGALSDFAVGVILRKLDLNGSTGSGQNALWCTQNALYRALLAEDPVQLKKIIDQNLSVNLRRGGLVDEAVQVDNSFHCHGNLLYSNGYGASLFRDMSFWIDTLAGTDFALPSFVIDLMAEYMLNGTRWMMRGDMLELALGYTPRDKHRYSGMYLAPLERMIKNDPSHAADYQRLLDSIRYDTKDAWHGLSGNKYMWTSGLMCHQRPGFGMNLRMNYSGTKSSEWRATWPNVDYGNLLFWTADATASVLIEGDEYYKVYKNYDWRHVPGVTAPYSITHYYWFDNDNNDCRGVSDGRYGTAAYLFHKQDDHHLPTDGKVSFFLFDEGYVALGTGISSVEEAPIHTTLNQTKAVNPSVDGQAVGETTDAIYTARYVYNNQVGYIFPENTQVHISHFDHATANYPSVWNTGYTQFGEQLNRDEVPDFTDNTFTLWLDHGIKPKDSSYMYMVLPGVSEDEAAAYSLENPITVLANNSTVQAVSHSGIHQTHIQFHEAGDFVFAEGKRVSVDTPCGLIIDESGDTPILTAALSNLAPNTTCRVTLTTEQREQTFSFTTKTDPYAGESHRLNG